MEILLIIMLAPLALALGMGLLQTLSSPTVWFSVLVAACLVALVVA